MTSLYFSIEELLQRIDEPQRARCMHLLNENRDRLNAARGGAHNHQAWSGGYLDHVQEIMNIAVVLYTQLSALRPLNFSLSDVLLVLFLHDLEKPWRYEIGEDGKPKSKSELKGWKKQHAFRMKKINEYNIELTEDHEQAIKYIEGEHGDYTENGRTMNPLAAFCHSCDVLSARLWFNHPLEKNDPWQGSQRSISLNQR